MGFPFTRPEGEPGTIRAGAGKFGDASSSASTAKTQLINGSNTALDGWNAAHATTFADATGQARGMISTAVTQLDTVPQPLNDFATALETAQDRYDELKEQWESEQQTIDSVAGMAEPSQADRQDSSSARAAQDRIEGQMQDALDELRRKGDSAASALDDATNAVVPGGASMSPDAIYGQVTAPWEGLLPASRSQLTNSLQDKSAWDYMVEGLAGQVAPPSNGDPAATGLWVSGRGLAILGGISSWMSSVQHGRFAPRVNGRYVAWKGQSLWRTGYQGMFSQNWQAGPYRSTSYARWGTISRWAGRAGFVASTAAAGWNQWSQDAGNPNLATSERVGRTAYRGAAVGAAAWGGAVLGAKAGAGIGAAIGSVIPGAGTGVGAVVGGVIGGIVGGVAASGIANEVVDETVDWVGNRVEDVSNAVGDIASDVGDVASDVGDAVTFWD